MLLDLRQALQSELKRLKMHQGVADSSPVIDVENDEGNLVRLCAPKVLRSAPPPPDCGGGNALSKHQGARPEWDGETRAQEHLCRRCLDTKNVCSSLKVAIDAANMEIQKICDHESICSFVSALRMIILSWQ